MNNINLFLKKYPPKKQAKIKRQYQAACEKDAVVRQQYNRTARVWLLMGWAILAIVAWDIWQILQAKLIN